MLAIAGPGPVTAPAALAVQQADPPNAAGADLIASLFMTDRSKIS
jgi:hypothetical protein